MKPDNKDSTPNKIKAIRAALEKICYEAAPKPVILEITKKLSYEVFPSLLSLKELKMVAKITKKYGIPLVDLTKVYKEIRDIYWEKEFYSQQKKNKRRGKAKEKDFLKDAGIKW